MLTRLAVEAERRVPDSAVILASISRPEGRRTTSEGGFAEDIQIALNPDIVVTRNNRVWRLSQPMGTDDGFLVGKFGYVQPVGNKSVEYDDASHEWAQSAGKLIHFRAVLRPPNPHWGKRTAQIERLLQPTDADKATLDLAIVDPGQSDGLVVRGTIIEQVVRHSESGYGTITAEAIDDGASKKFNSRRKVHAVRIAESIARLPETLIGALKGIVRSNVGAAVDGVGPVEPVTSDAQKTR